VLNLIEPATAAPLWLLSPTGITKEVVESTSIFFPEFGLIIKSFISVDIILE
jgi:hypothetical protein